MIQLTDNLYGVIVPKINYDPILGEWVHKELKLPINNYELLGHITKDEISFDVSEYIDCSEFSELLKTDIERWFSKCNNKFRSLIESKSKKYFENPMSKKFPVLPVGNIIDIEEKYRQRLMYESYEKNLIDKMLILKKTTT